MSFFCVALRAVKEGRLAAAATRAADRAGVRKAVARSRSSCCSHPEVIAPINNVYDGPPRSMTRVP
jgi:hypothetical protein